PGGGAGAFACQVGASDFVGQVGNPMPLVFCPAISAGSAGRSSRSTQSLVFAWSLWSISVPRFLQVSGRGKNERHWVGNLRPIGNRPDPKGTPRPSQRTGGGNQPPRRLATCPTWFFDSGNL